LNGAPDLDGVSWPYLRQIGSVEADGFVLNDGGFPSRSKKGHWLELLQVCIHLRCDLVDDGFDHAGEQRQTQTRHPATIRRSFGLDICQLQTAPKLHCETTQESR